MTATTTVVDPVPTGATTVTRPTAAPESPRPIARRTLDDRASLIGAAAGSLGFVWICYTQILPFSGLLGFLVCWWLVFLAAYSAVTAVSNPRTVVADRLAAAVVTSACSLVLLALALTIGFTFYRGFSALAHVNFYVNDMSGVAPQADLDQGGVLHAVIGSLIQIGIAVAITVPLGVGAAIYMTEVGGPFAKVVRTVVEAMTALPSIIAGLFIYTVLLVTFHVPRSGIAAALAISVMGLPIIARTSDVVLRVIPSGLREASYSLGASRWQTVWRVVLPTARPGLATALILGVARMIGETSPVLLTSGTSAIINKDPFHEQMNSLPLFIFSGARSGEPMFIARAFGAAALLLALVLMLFVAARLLARTQGRR